MTKTILIGVTNRLSSKTSKVIFAIIGVIYMLSGASKYYQFGASVESISFFLFGVVIIAYGVILFTATPISPRVQVNDSEIVMRTKLFGTTEQLSWSSIQSIAFDSYEIEFETVEGRRSLSYKANPETSLEIKRSIRAMAESKDIEITGG